METYKSHQIDKSKTNWKKKKKNYLIESDLVFKKDSHNGFALKHFLKVKFNQINIILYVTILKMEKA